jgi:predicted phosphodiesterase
MKSIRKRLPAQSEQEVQAWNNLIRTARKTGIAAALDRNPWQSCPIAEKWLILSDVHRPFHDKKLWDKVLHLIQHFGKRLTGIILAGDYLDLFCLGSFNADSVGLLQGIDLDFEYKDGLQGIEELEMVLHPGAKKRFLFGNHEDRYFRCLNTRDNAKFGAALKNPVEALELQKRGWEVKTRWNKDFYLLGDLEVIHGLYSNNTSPKVYIQKAGRSVLYGHTHCIASAIIGDKAAYNIGGLFDRETKGLSYTDRYAAAAWCNGFAVVDVIDGRAFVNTVPVINGKFIVDGIVW